MDDKNVPLTSENETQHRVREHEGLILIPAPSDDPRDPLNWPMYRKVAITAVLSLSIFAGYAGPFSGQLNLKAPAKLYGKTTVEAAYQISLATAGTASGGYFIVPLSYKFGRSSIIFWSLVCTLLCQVWAGLMTHHDDYNGLIVSRFFSAFFGAITGALGPQMLVDIFFLHQRGRAFTVFFNCVNLGAIGSPTLSALISSTGMWTLEYWWTVGLLGGTIVLVFLILHETTWSREPGSENPVPPETFLANRWATFFPGTRVTRHLSARQIARKAAIPFLISASPVTMFVGFHTLISFGLKVTINIMVPVFLQRPVSQGGYGFTTWQTALFTLANWAGLSIAQIYGHFISDRLPLWICGRLGGNWKPEYRLHALWLPSIIVNPIGLALFGYVIAHHLSWGLLVLAEILTAFGALSISPVVVNYLCECFVGTPGEAAITANAYRVLFGLSVTFYIIPWIDRVGIAWAYGMMALLALASFWTIIVLLLWGHTIREWSWGGLNVTEEGVHVVDRKREDAETT